MQHAHQASYAATQSACFLSISNALLFSVEARAYRVRDQSRREALSLKWVIAGRTEELWGSAATQCDRRSNPFGGKLIGGKAFSLLQIVSRTDLHFNTPSRKIDTP